MPVVPAYASAAAPTVPEALRTLAARGRHRIAVASCFTAPGLFATRATAHAPWIASAPSAPTPPSPAWSSTATTRPSHSSAPSRN